MLMIVRTRASPKALLFLIDVHSKRNNNKEGVQHRIGGFHQDTFEIISQRKGKSS